MKHFYTQKDENNTNESSSTQMDVETPETKDSVTLFPILNLPEEVIRESLITQLGAKELLSFRGLSQSTKQIIDNYAHSHQQWQAIYAKGGVSFFINFKGEVYACGQNREGMLGLGHNNKVNILQRISFFEDKKIKQIKMGIDHALFLCEDGKVFVCGSNAYGQLGVEGIENANAPVQLMFNDMAIKEVLAETYKSIFITCDDQVYVCGRNDYGQLGVGHRNTVTKPTQINLFKYKSLKKILFGDFCTHFLTQDGKNYICGFNMDGPDNLHTPKQVDFFKDKPLEEIIFKGLHTFYIAEVGHVYACGVNARGQLGLGHKNAVKTPAQLNFLININLKQIIVAGRQSFFLTKDGQAYACGNNENGQLGLRHNNDVSAPMHVTFFEDNPLAQIIASNKNTLFLTQDGRVYECGSFLNKNTPTQIVFPKNITIAQIQHGESHMLFLSHDRQVFVYGKNYDGQLGLGHNYTVSKPAHISLFKDKSLQKLGMLADEKISANKDKENIAMDVIEQEEKKPFRCG